MSGWDIVKTNDFNKTYEAIYEKNNSKRDSKEELEILSELRSLGIIENRAGEYYITSEEALKDYLRFATLVRSVYVLSVIELRTRKVAILVFSL